MLKARQGNLNASGERGQFRGVLDGGPHLAFTSPVRNLTGEETITLRSPVGRVWRKEEREREREEERRGFI